MPNFVFFERRNHYSCFMDKVAAKTQKDRVATGFLQGNMWPLHLGNNSEHSYSLAMMSAHLDSGPSKAWLVFSL